MKPSGLLTSSFNEKSSQSKQKPRAPRTRSKRPAPVSLRLNETELDALRKASAGRSMNGYIRERLFGDADAIGLTKPVAKDHVALARVLGALGHTDVFTSLAAISLALEEQRLIADGQIAEAIFEAHDAIVEMRTELLLALGLRKT